MQGSKDMWLLRATTQLLGVSIQGRPGYHQEVCGMPRGARSMESGVSDEKGGIKQNQSSARNTTQVPPDPEGRR